MSHEDGLATFLARVGKTTGGSDEVEPIELRGAEFLRCWSLHILSKGFTKTRRFGGYWNDRCKDYLTECCELLASAGLEAEPAETFPVSPLRPFPTLHRAVRGAS